MSGEAVAVRDVPAEHRFVAQDADMLAQLIYKTAPSRLIRVHAEVPEHFAGRGIGGQWVHVRLCMRCGHVGCCDSSPHRHATGHWHAHNDHPIIRSYEPGEDWWWWYLDELSFDVPGAPSSPSHT